MRRVIVEYIILVTRVSWSPRSGINPSEVQGVVPATDLELVLHEVALLNSGGDLIADQDQVGNALVIEVDPASTTVNQAVSLPPNLPNEYDDVIKR